MGSTIQQGTESQGYRMRADRRPTQGQILSVDKITQTASIDIKFANTQGQDVYLEDVPYQPQNPPSVGDNVTIGYTNASPHSAIILGSQLSGQNTTASLQVVGGVSSLRLSTETVGTKGDLVLTAGAGIVITRNQGNFNISAPTGSFAPATAAPLAIAASSLLGSDTAHFALADHTHQGVHSLGIAGAGGSSSLGDVKLYAGANITLTPKSDGIQIDAAGGSGSGTGGTPSPLTTKGDLYVYDTTNDRLPVGTDGQVLSADSTQSTGLKWVTFAPSGSGTGGNTTVAYFWRTPPPVGFSGSTDYYLPPLSGSANDTRVVACPVTAMFKNTSGLNVTIRRCNDAFCTDLFENGIPSFVLASGAAVIFMGVPQNGDATSQKIWTEVSYTTAFVNTASGGNLQNPPAA